MFVGLDAAELQTIDAAFTADIDRDVRQRTASSSLIRGTAVRRMLPL